MPIFAQKFLTSYLMNAVQGYGLQRESLAVESLLRGGRLRLQVTGESMLPALWPGDVAHITACSLEEVSPGDVALAFRDGRLFLHRLLGRSQADFVMRGDSMPGDDPVYSARDLLGKLTSLERAGRALSVPAPLRPWSRALGLFFCHCRWARSAALKWHCKSGSASALRRRNLENQSDFSESSSQKPLAGGSGI